MRLSPSIRRATIAATAGAALVPAAAHPQHPEGAIPTAAHVRPDYEPVGEEAAAAWRADIEQFGAELERRHGDVFHTTDRASFEAALADLAARVPGLARHEIVAGLMRVAASIGDGHTAVQALFDPAVGLRPVPVRFAEFEEGVFVRAAGPGAEELAGAELVAVGDASIEAARAALAPLVARDNDIWLRVVVPTYLGFPEILHAVGLSNDPERATYTFRTAAGDVIRELPAGEPLVLSHGPEAIPRGWADARPPQAWQPPAALRPRPLPYWSAYLPDEATLYVRFDQVNDAPHGPGVHEFFRTSFADAEERGMRRVILDIRANHGGEGMLNYGIVREILSRPRLNRPGGVYVIIGRGTFSAAQMLAHLLDLWTDAVFVGEPTGSSPRFWGDHAVFRLKNSGILVSASPTWWQPGGPYDLRPFLPPTWAFEPRFDDYVAGRDPAIESILGDVPVSLERRVRDALAGGSADSLPAVVRSWATDPVNRYVPATSELNGVGYALLGEGSTEAALAVFRSNVQLHPGYANGWDSLGEALLAAGRHDEGLAAYRRAYELDPAVGRAAEVLERAGERRPGS
jgi:hypothetical protein